MSWFKRSPRKHEPTKPRIAPHHTSPATRRIAEKAKSLNSNSETKNHKSESDK